MVRESFENLNPKFEIRNKFKIQSRNALNHERHTVAAVSVIWIFGFEFV